MTDASATTYERAGRSPLAALTAGRAELGTKLAGLVLPFTLVLYLALRGGGYDAVVRGEVGVAVAWIVLLGAAVGVLPAARLTHAGWLALLALCAFAAWTGVSALWSESSERSVAELARVATYVAIFALALSVQGRDGLRRTVSAIAAALAIVGALALLSRLHPSWFPANDVATAIEDARPRLSYPVNYWNGLAALMAIATPLLLTVAVGSRRLATQALATAALPVVALAAFYTLSRGGAVEFAIALATFLILFPRRLAALPSLALGALGAALLIVAATQRDALADGFTTATALDQGDEMLILTLVVCAGVALVRAALGLVARHGRLPEPRVSRRATLAAAGGVAVIAVVIGLAAGGAGELSNRWEQFKQPLGPEANASAERFESASGNGRYQYWQAAVDANATEPLAGIGAGTYEYFWAREGELPGFVRDAHSLYLEALAELGIPGLLLILGLIGGVIVAGARRTTDGAAADRLWAAAATAACVAFAVASAIDWGWELAVIPVVFLSLAAPILAPGERARASADGPGARARVGLAVVAAAALVCIAASLLGLSSVRASQADARELELDSALTSARNGERIQPYAASPSLQAALVLELGGDLDAAAASAAEATEAEPTNWRTWLVLSRIEAYRGNAEASVEAYRAARSLNPRSPLFAR